MPPRPDVAVPHGADIAELSRHLASAYDQFIGSGRREPGLRQLVLDSWARSLDGGIDPEVALADIRLDDETLAAVRSSHPLSVGMPVIRRLLVDNAAESGLLVAVSDAAGHLLWVEGAHQLRAKAEGMNFVPGADWSEGSAGTNAPGTALALDRPVQIFGPEHLARHVTSWSCSAAPIHDPHTGAVLGVLDLTGGPGVATPQTLDLVRATVAAVEAELRIERLSRTSPASPAVRPARSATLDVLGSHGGVLHAGPSVRRLSVRHSEMLLLLLESSDGLTAAELAVALSDDDHAQVTVRAELSRLRSTVAPLDLQSRPYRVRQPVVSDVAQVRRELREGRLRQAVAVYRGPVLPTSVAPGVERIRDQLHHHVRSSLLACDDADALLSFADTPHGLDDYEIWRHTLEVLAPDSPRRAQVEQRLGRLDTELA
jgi:transcriptional regulator of acetoin/glycerol metabolism